MTCQPREAARQWVPISGARSLECGVACKVRLKSFQPMVKAYPARVAQGPDASSTLHRREGLGFDHDDDNTGKNFD